ncbi:endonuclease/exonuclease/phosphatase family protein [Microbacterium sp. 1P10UB]|uniref:endonuclease/exonuclease/phosphatase family protein n=1 Tax=unclassified Microbacterium TaxID=2609290 RepID=UPI00399FF388
MTGGPLVGAVPAPALHLMTLNVRRRMAPTRRVDDWARRAPLLGRLLRHERPAVIGVQEALPDQASALGDALGDGYRRVGRGRGRDGRGEGCPVFFDTGRLELLSWTQSALSDTPDQPGSMSWGNLMPRTVVDVRLRDRATGRGLRVLNTHLDPFSARSRMRSAERLRLLAAETAGAVVVLGDMNSLPASEVAAELYAEGVLRDAWGAAHERVTPPWDTFGGYRPPRARGRRIDWIAITRDVDVERVGVNAASIGGLWPSDHLPVQAVVRLTEEPA